MVKAAVRSSAGQDTSSARDFAPVYLEESARDHVWIHSLPWADLAEHARQRPQTLMTLPLWSGLRLQAFAQAGPLLQAPLIASPLPLRAAEQLLIQQALHEALGNVSLAAKSLGLSRATLYRRLAGKRRLPASPTPLDLP